MENKLLIGICGYIGSGKNAASDYFQHRYGFEHLSFADSLKRAIAAIFKWDFELLRGSTHESRVWREIVDEWWAKRLKYSKFIT